MKPEKITAWKTVSNTDLTEGRGKTITLGICKLKSTAQRIGKGRYVQGTDCPVSEVEIERRGHVYWGPIDLVNPSKEDVEKQEGLDKAAEVKKKALKLGLTEEELKTLERGANK